MLDLDLHHQARVMLRYLCGELESRRVGSRGNQQAVGWAADALAQAGFVIEKRPFDCMDWRTDGAELAVGGLTFPVESSPYSRGCSVSAELTAADSLEALQNQDPTGKILLMHAALTAEQLMPKNFPFYNPEEHRQIIRALEARPPLAIITAAGRGGSMTGGLYPYPNIEDGDFDIPSVFTDDRSGESLLSFLGQTARLTSRCQRIPSFGENLIARTGSRGPRVVLSAHIDAKPGTPGALDNAAGVVTLLLLARLLEHRANQRLVEIVLFNGEDYYASSGELAYLPFIQEHKDEILLNINLDGLGYREGKTAYSFVELSAPLAETARAVFARHPGLLEGSPWYQSDHMVFVQNGVGAMALTSQAAADIFQRVTHTPLDSIDQVDVNRLVETAFALKEYLEEINT